MDGCMEARAAITIGEIPCPRCRESMEIFIKDGALAAEAVCEKCGYTIPAGAPASFENGWGQSRKKMDER